MVGTVGCGNPERISSTLWIEVHMFLLCGSDVERDTAVVSAAGVGALTSYLFTNDCNYGENKGG